jgi:hypothetical protein
MAGQRWHLWAVASFYLDFLHTFSSMEKVWMIKSVIKYNNWQFNAVSALWDIIKDEK